MHSFIFSYLFNCCINFLFNRFKDSFLLLINFSIWLTELLVLISINLLFFFNQFLLLNLLLIISHSS